MGLFCRLFSAKPDTYLLSVRSPYLSGTSIFVRILFLRCPCRSQEKVGNVSFHWSADRGGGGVGVGPFETLDLCFKGIKTWSRRLLQLVCQICRYFGSRECFSLCKASHACCIPVYSPSRSCCPAGDGFPGRHSCVVHLPLAPACFTFFCFLTKITSFHWAPLKHSSSHSLTLKGALQALTVQPRQIDVNWYTVRRLPWNSFLFQSFCLPSLHLSGSQTKYHFEPAASLCRWPGLLISPICIRLLRCFFNKRYCPWPSLSVRLINSTLSHCFFGGSSELDGDFSIPVLRPPPRNFDYSSTIVTNVKIWGSSDVLFSFVCFLVYYYIALCLHLS